MVTRKEKNNQVVVIGGGIAGCSVAEQLNHFNITVHIIEKDNDIGGHVRDLGCKATDVCMRCNVCVADEIFRSVRKLPNVFIHTNSELLDIRHGKHGNRYAVDFISSEVKKGENSKIKGGGSDAGTNIPLTVSKTGVKTIDADAIVVAIGFEPYHPLENSSYGYRNVSNVITGIEAEQQLASRHKIVRPSDSEIPKRVAFIQCVGSRTTEIFRCPEDTDYCSVVCCAYALRIARLMKYQTEESHITVFYMDIQNFGKGFNEFYKESRKRMRFLRARPYEIKSGSNGSVRIKYTTEGAVRADGDSVCEEEFDLAVLAVGMRPPLDGWKLADKLGVPLDEHGFFGLKGADGLPDMQREGMYAVGANESPKDITGCIAQARAISSFIEIIQ